MLTSGSAARHALHAEDEIGDPAQPDRQGADREARLARLAARCEAADAIGRDLDCEIYEALGFVVRRKPTSMRTHRTPHGGIFLQGVTWKAVGRITVETSVVIDILGRTFPDLTWRLGHDPAGTVAFVATVEGESAAAPTPALALTAALLRASFALGTAQARLAPREMRAAAKARALVPMR